MKEKEERAHLVGLVEDDADLVLVARERLDDGGELVAHL